MTQTEAFVGSESFVNTVQGKNRLVELSSERLPFVVCLPPFFAPAHLFLTVSRALRTPLNPRASVLRPSPKHPSRGMHLVTPPRVSYAAVCFFLFIFCVIWDVCQGAITRRPTPTATSTN